ncbi:MAG: hypothetical protein OEZ39_09765 [Gammaproteobacteria bacterium]|nr:hypothetical protein [Gammaproteobacteria bacterium]MDH5652131.1 hypothetical protein [Gammaproteobacteria bacterium]
MTLHFNITIEELGHTLEPVMQQLIATHHERDTTGLQLTDPSRLTQAMQQVLAILNSIEAQSGPESVEAENLTVDQIDLGELGEYGLGLLSQLTDWQNIFQLENTGELYKATLSLALWLANQGGKIRNLEHLVNSVSFLANRSRDKAILENLAEVITFVIDAIDPALKEDLPGSPWLFLNMNYGIVATRSHNPDIMNKVFDKLLLNIPNNVGSFFQEGMEQMDTVGYPDHVRKIMQKYYNRSRHRVLH